ncbi:hypothetical protein AGMMS49944_02800 [Spirochaetia bacterium]|nr:hypothetical protein AGMMS49944_02800 [Spirochaetia bacterium]
MKKHTTLATVLILVLNGALLFAQEDETALLATQDEPAPLDAALAETLSDLDAEIIASQAALPEAPPPRKRILPPLPRSTLRRIRRPLK